MKTYFLVLACAVTLAGCGKHDAQQASANPVAAATAEAAPATQPAPPTDDTATKATSEARQIIANLQRKFPPSSNPAGFPASQSKQIAAGLYPPEMVSNGAAYDPWGNKASISWNPIGSGLFEIFIGAPIGAPQNTETVDQCADTMVDLSALLEDVETRKFNTMDISLPPGDGDANAYNGISTVPEVDARRWCKEKGAGQIEISFS